MRHSLVFAAVLFAVVAVLIPEPAFTFGTINAGVQNAEHEKITRLGLAGFNIGAKTIDEIAGKTGTFGAVGSPDVRLIFQKSAHCDGGDFLAVAGYPQTAAGAAANIVACRKWIFSKLDEAVTDAKGLLSEGTLDKLSYGKIPCIYSGKKGRAKCNVLEDLGVALHTAQDFYAHSNWADAAAPGAITPGNPPGLNQPGIAAYINPLSRTAGFPKGLITGCFDGVPESQHCTYASGKLRIKHAFLTKDTGSIDVATGASGKGTTPRGAVANNFAKAVAIAIADTHDKWAWFEAAVLKKYGAKNGKLIICRMRSDDASACS